MSLLVCFCREVSWKLPARDQANVQGTALLCQAAAFLGGLRDELGWNPTTEWLMGGRRQIGKADYQAPGLLPSGDFSSSHIYCWIGGLQFREG